MRKLLETRIHSSRRRTARFSGHLLGVSAQGDGVCLVGGVCPGDVCPGGCLPGGSATLPCGQTDACENITLPQTSFAGGNNRFLLLIALQYKTQYFSKFSSK